MHIPHQWPVYMLLAMQETSTQSVKQQVFNNYRSLKTKREQSLWASNEKKRPQSAYVATTYLREKLYLTTAFTLHSIFTLFKFCSIDAQNNGSYYLPKEDFQRNTLSGSHAKLEKLVKDWGIRRNPQNSSSLTM